MVDFISDVRRTQENKKLPFVIATTGMAPRLKQHRELMTAQRSMANFKKYPQHRGNVAAVDTSGFWRPKEISPANNLSHWNFNAESYYLIGEGMGKAMINLLATE